MQKSGFSALLCFVLPCTFCIATPSGRYNLADSWLAFYFYFFAKINQVLNDEEQRQRYDQFGEAGIGRGGGGGGAGFDVRDGATFFFLLTRIVLPFMGS